MPKASAGTGTNGARFADPGAGSRRPAVGRRLPGGLTAQQVADDIGVHRTIAYRLLTTLAQYRFVAKGEDGRYRSASALAVLGASFDNNVRQLSLPTLRALADELGTTVSLLIAEGDQQVAIAVIVPTNVFYQLSFHEGSRYPLERGAAGIALLASMPPRPASGTSSRRPASRAGSSPTARSSRTPTAWPCRSDEARRRRRRASTSSPPRGCGHAAAETQSSRRPTNYPRSSGEGPSAERVSNGDRLGQRSRRRRAG